MPIEPMLLAILACPKDKGPLYYVQDEEVLYNPRLRLSYPVRDGIPIMLVDEAHNPSEQEHELLMAKISEKGIRPTFEPGEPRV